MKKYIWLVLLITKLVCSHEPEPYCSINLLKPDSHGWFRSINRDYLALFMSQIQPKIVVELGSWLGASTIFMASQLPSDAKLYAVDHWLGTGNQIPEITSRLSNLYQQFLSNIKHAQLTHIVIPVRMKTDEAARALQIKPDLVYIDALHTEDAVFNDIINWYDKLNKNGICCGDDWDAPAVKRGVQKAAEKLGVEIKSDICFWYFDPKP
jgi:hypothetical protein